MYDVHVLRVAQVVADTEAEGPGRRFAVWVQGCPLRCPGCCNPEMLPDVGGVVRPVEEVAAEMLATDGIEGLSLLGGEPFAQAAGCAELARLAREAGLGVMVFSGFTLEELQARRGDEGVADLLAACDLLVDGRYVREEPESRRRWVGSRNQVMHFLSARYSPEEVRFSARNTVELRLTAKELVVNGWPAASRALRGGR